MKLQRVEIRNFKLLTDVRLDFSTDPEKPLTIVRAENGSGKTSLLYALLWGFYGRTGLPDYARELRLTSSASPVNQEINVSVMIEFSHDAGGGESRYRLIRSVTETPDDHESFKRTDERVRLYRLTDAGEDPVEHPEAFVTQMIPPNLRKVFFTNGDEVQDFMSGKVNNRERQEQVHSAIKSLLGLDQLYIARKDLTRVQARMRKQVAEGGSSELQSADQAVEAAQSMVESLKENAQKLEGELARMRDSHARWDSELTKLTGVGDLDAINVEIQGLKKDLSDLDKRESTLLSTMRDGLKSEALGWDIAGVQLQAGLSILGDLADRGVIPGTAIEVLVDRLQIEECICGTSLESGTEARRHIKHLIEHQREVSERDQRLTEALHVARSALQTHDARAAAGDTFTLRRAHALNDSIELTDTIREKKTRLKHAEGKRAQIDEEHVKTLVKNIQDVTPKIAERDRELARNSRDLEIETEKLTRNTSKFEQLERDASLSATKKARLDAATDLSHLIDRMINTLEDDHVRQVEQKMAEMFLDIVGSDPELDASVFAEVSINADFDIEVRDPRGHTLDFDAEINGASQRALTLSFIWALMEVAGAEAPRTIDTPLGMVSGAVKSRMVQSITTPRIDGAPFQLLLLLTRSEINNVEDELGQRAGVIRTMTCSTDTSDLQYLWGTERPQVRLCTCDLSTTCRICTRVKDDERGFAFHDSEAEAL